jgi:hypothetical protein
MMRMTRTTRARLAGIAAGIAGMVLAGPAVAGEDESALSASVGIASWWQPFDDPKTPTKDDKHGPTAGGALAVEYEHGFSEAFSWRVAGTAGLFGVDGLSGGGWVTGGLVYRFDVLKYVPYAVGGLGGLVLAGGPLTETAIEPVLELGVGLDVLTGRTRSWGAEARVVMYPDDVTAWTVGVRGTTRWGFF